LLVIDARTSIHTQQIPRRALRADDGLDSCDPEKRRPVQHQPDHQGDIDPGRQTALWIVFGFVLTGMPDCSFSIRMQCSTDARGCENEQRIFDSE